ncbi:ferrous iron transport protein A [Synechococcus sp. BSF8S]|uniref:FeoA family protein n=1 Tax=Synechococcales TaxID=1890424 RepID=UPI001629E6F3|nr:MULTISPECIES: FeoA domain-containing protein [unclassified Synechococcus]MBC1261948.1 ferrous iron transport protein A [Synechococcus sp. BSF8S]MBC1264875.1 ferrous iron transport protein A [Synechococcus sp. BSA11S]MCP9819291.1 FeoA domain-containing protein [Synechococcus sp. Cruz-9H2]MCP9843085.1 FeoA domain-containing protein [Synechococcus sp. Edmonson 11F2]MCP9854829.1 FeoA domain-containing protein [Synechococcus sp. Cruz-9C9]
MPLNAAREGARVRVESLTSNSVLESRLLSMGIRPGVQIEVLRRGKPGGILHVACGILEFMIRHEDAAHVQVSVDQ